jgi:hypothetical protein
MPSTLTASLVQTSSYAQPGIGFYSYIVQVSTGNYYDTSTSTFVPLSAAVAPAINFTETPTPTPTDTWSWTLGITLPAWFNGYYMISSFQLLSSVVTPAATPYSIYIFDGMTPADYAATFTALNQNTGGTNNMQYVQPNGCGVGGATINVYTLADYNAAVLTGCLGTTTTNPDGTWTDSIMVPSGNTYAIQFFLSGQWGPDVIEVTV